MNDAVNHPPHYNQHPSGVECIDIAQHYGFCVGNAIKYLWRAGLKGDAIQDLEKARWYIDREILRRRQQQPPSQDQILAEIEKAMRRTEATGDQRQPGVVSL